MEMRRYVRHTPLWWITGLALALLAAGLILLGLRTRQQQQQLEPLPLGEQVCLDDYNYIDVQYMTDWVYKVTLGDGGRKTFYIAWDTSDYGYLVSLSDEQYAEFADIVAYTYSDDSDVPDAAQGDAGQATLTAYLPLTAVTAPPPRRLTGVICGTPEEYILDIAESNDMTGDEFVSLYGDYYIDAMLTPGAEHNDWFYIGVFAAWFAFWLLVTALIYAIQLSGVLKHLRKQRLQERAESEFHYLQGDRRLDALVSTAFVYGRRQNLVLPLSEVLWVYRHDTKFLWVRRTVVQLLTYDGRSIALRLGKSGSRRMADAVVQAIAQRNPEVLVGLNRENQRLYSQQVPHAKQKQLWTVAGSCGGAVLGVLLARYLLQLLYLL